MVFTLFKSPYILNTYNITIGFNRRKHKIVYRVIGSALGRGKWI